MALCFFSLKHLVSIFNVFTHSSQQGTFLETAHFLLVMTSQGGCHSCHAMVQQQFQGTHLLFGVQTW